MSGVGDETRHRKRLQQSPGKWSVSERIQTVASSRRQQETARTVVVARVLVAGVVALPVVVVIALVAVTVAAVAVPVPVPVAVAVPVPVAVVVGVAAVLGVVWFDGRSRGRWRLRIVGRRHSGRGRRRSRRRGCRRRGGCGRDRARGQGQGWGWGRRRRCRRWSRRWSGRGRRDWDRRHDRAYVHRAWWWRRGPRPPAAAARADCAGAPEEVPVARLDGVPAMVLTGGTGGSGAGAGWCDGRGTDVDAPCPPQGRPSPQLSARCLRSPSRTPGRRHRRPSSLRGSRLTTPTAPMRTTSRHRPPIGRARPHGPLPPGRSRCPRLGWQRPNVDGCRHCCYASQR